MRVLICGSRDWDDESVIFNVLSMLWMNDESRNTIIIEGGARGADAAAAKWVEREGTFPMPKHLQFPADWEKYGKAAGPIRNQQMIDEGKPNVVWAFKDYFDYAWVTHSALRMSDDKDKYGRSHGTEDMVRRAKAAGIPCYVVSRA